MTTPSVSSDERSGARLILRRARLQSTALANRLFPPVFVRWVAAARAERAKRDPRAMARARAEMTFLIERSGCDADLENAAAKYLEWEAWRRLARWHRSLLGNQPVEGIEHLLDAYARGRGVILTSMHYGVYEGAAISIVQAGGPGLEVLASPRCFEKGAKPTDKQYARITSKVTNIHSAGIGVNGVIEMLKAGKVVSMATDMPGSMPLRFAGREVRGSSGVAWAATTAGSLLVPMTYESKERGWAIRVHPALDAQQFDSPQELMQTITALQEPYLLATPEATLDPMGRWNTAGGPSAQPDSRDKP